MGCGASAESTQKKKQPTSPEDRIKDKKAAKDENKAYQMQLQFLEHVPLMKRLPKDQHPLVASVCEMCEYKKGDLDPLMSCFDFFVQDTIFKQGDTGQEFFVIRSGEASVFVTDEKGVQKKVAGLKSGDYFGEKALLREEPRTATIKADTMLSTLKITQKAFQELGLHEKLQFANRRAVGGGGGVQQKAKPPTAKTSDDIALITEALRNNENLATMTTLDEARLRAFVDVMWKEEVKEGQRIIVEGDLQADYFYVVESGRFEISMEESDENGQSAENALHHAESKVLNVLSQGGSFGELALLYFVPRAATVQAITDGVVWVIDRSNFKDILMKVSDNKLKEYVRYLNDVSILDTLLETEKKALAKALVEMHFTQGEMVVQQDEPGNTFYIMYEGNVDIIKDGSVVANLEHINQLFWAPPVRPMSCEQCSGICSSHGTCLSASVLPVEAETPSWNEFAGMHLLWPGAMQILLTVLITCVRPIYTAIRDRSTRVRIFLRRYIGMPDKRRVTCVTPQILIQILRLAAALSHTYIYAVKTYTKGSWNANNIGTWETGFSCFFVFTYLLERVSEGFQLRFWNPKAVVDVFVITPIFFPYGLDAEPVPMERRWLSLCYLRIITALGAFRTLQHLFRDNSQQQDTVLGRCVLTMLRLTTMIVCMAGTMFSLEVLGEIPGMEDTFLTVGMGDLSIMQMIYWITTTISTVGYGDFSPTTVPSRIIIIFFIFGGVIFFGSETSEIVEIFNDTEQGHGSYVNHWLEWKQWMGHRVGSAQIVITGNGCHMSSPLMETLLLETLTVTDDQWNVEGPDLVFLSDKEYDFDLKAFVETELGPGQAAKVFFLRGSVLNARDLERAQIKTSKLCFVIPDYAAEATSFSKAENTTHAVAA
eukprot:symbB.v1.2.019514.t2/scaffold1557.1/size112825/13